MNNITLSISGAFNQFLTLSTFILTNSWIKKYNIIVHDGINNCAWNGGRINRDISWKQSQIDFYYKRNIGIALTMSNSEIDLTDEVGNELLEKFHREGNSIILVNEDLRLYIREKFPKYKLTFSITGARRKIKTPMTDDCIKEFNLLEEKYDLIVPLMEHVRDIRFRHNIDLSKYELLVNDSCSYNCPLYNEHFDAIGKTNIRRNVSEEEKMAVERCWLDTFDELNMDAAHSMNNLTKEEIHRYIEKGVRNLKLSGRELSSERFEGNLEILKNLVI